MKAEGKFFVGGNWKCNGEIHMKGPSSSRTAAKA